MITEVTRHLCASMYTNAVFRDKVIALVKNPFRTVVDSPATDTKLLLTHALMSRKRERNRDYALFIPSIVFWGVFVTFSISPGGSVGIFIGLSFFAILCIFSLTQVISDKGFLKRNFQLSNFNPSFVEDALKTEIEKLNHKICKNVVYYSGYSPFVGHGLDIGGWSFVVDVDKGKSTLDVTLEPEEIDEKDLYDCLTKELTGLNFPNFTISDKVFFNGKKIRANKDLLPDIFSHPVPEISKELFDKSIFNKVPGARYYKVIQVSDWEGDLILTAFIRFQKDDKTLFVENNYYILPPISNRFKELDHQKEESGLTSFLTQIVSTPLLALFLSLKSIVKVLSYITEAIRDALDLSTAAEKRRIKETPDYDYGSETTIRESATQYDYEQHFQKLDQERYFKIIEKRIFNAIYNFLDTKGIDTSDFKERETRILNNGVIVTGGTVNSDNIAVGKGAKIKSEVKNKQQQPV